MCIPRSVYCYYTVCRHTKWINTYNVPCGEQECKGSTTHWIICPNPDACVHEQVLKPDQRDEPEIDGLCDDCFRRMLNAGRR
ncbi:hypothetical protein OE88DRAFT_1089139 [Heliocybe sulcata]|uniref:Uncharacterized protein n=1 Tax=Heliocybe sulcata TaxID=5364 RepID=A0A5C3MLU8_9AGAM|nr:hypothetical protein OE88DRAFT_1089139 [Heliocybe sulcata]